MQLAQWRWAGWQALAAAKIDRWAAVLGTSRVVNISDTANLDQKVVTLADTD